MTFEQYEAENNRLNALIRDNHAAFIEANKPCNVGDIVEQGKNKGVVVGFEIFWRKVRPKAMKLKKNGECSMYSLYLSDGNWKII